MLFRSLPAFQTALTVIDKIIKDGGVSTRAELEAKLTTALDKVASAAITKYVISKVMDVYDTSSQKLNDVADVSKILINVRAAIKSGITLAASDQRPILIVPAP